ncbi:MAG: nucleotide pyrophosphohydrolase [Planctomycetota bacterium]
MKFQSDSETTVQDLKELMAEFVAERDWQQFHSPKNLSMSIAIEAAELMEHFQWITHQQSRELKPDAVAEVSEELADIICYAVSVANEMGIDIASCMSNKMKKNRLKYPAEEFKGRFGHNAPRS